MRYLLPLRASSVILTYLIQWHVAQATHTIPNLANSDTIIRINNFPKKKVTAVKNIDCIKGDGHCYFRVDEVQAFYLPTLKFQHQ